MMLTLYINIKKHDIYNITKIIQLILNNNLTLNIAKLLKKQHEQYWQLEKMQRSVRPE